MNAPLKKSFLETITPIRFCKNNPEKDVQAIFYNAIQDLPIYNIFNPSFYISDTVQIFAFRAIPKNNDLICSYLLVIDSGIKKIYNLSIEFFNFLNSARLIDPKIFKINDQLFVTFNTGWIPNGNQLYVLKIYPHLGVPKKVDYEQRTKQERNWGFFSVDNDVYALYSLAPLRILKLQVETEDCWKFGEYYLEKNPSLSYDSNLSIGTQPYFHNHAYYLIAHKKVYIFNRKVYFGKLCKFDFSTKKLLIDKYWRVDSLKSLLGTKLKHNTNLFSCTYFSGLQFLNQSLISSYGVNDLDYGFSRIEENAQINWS